MTSLALKHAASHSVVGATLLCSLLIQGCAPYESRHQNQWNSREQIWLSEASQLKIRAAQTRAFDTTDRRRMFEAIVSTMQDLDFNVEVLDEELGIISGKKFIEVEQPYGPDPSYLLYRPDTLHSSRAISMRGVHSNTAAISYVSPSQSALVGTPNSSSEPAHNSTCRLSKNQAHTSNSSAHWNKRFSSRASPWNEAPRSSLLRRSSRFDREGRKRRGIRRRRITHKQFPPTSDQPPHIA